MRELEPTAASELDELVAAEARFRERRERARAEADRLINDARASARSTEELAERALEEDLRRLREQIDDSRRREEGAIEARAQALEERFAGVRDDALAELTAMVIDALLSAKEPVA